MRIVKEGGSLDAVRAVRLLAYLMRCGVAPGNSASLNVVVAFARDRDGYGLFTLKAGEVKARAPTLAGAVLAALDQVGFHDGR